MISPKPDSFYHTEHKMALGYQNPFYLKQAQKMKQSLYNGKVLLDKHDPPAVYDSEDTLQLAQESRLKMKQLNKEIKPANYAKVNNFQKFLFLKRPSQEKRMSLNVNNWSSPVHIEIQKIFKEEIASIINQVYVLEYEKIRLLRAVVSQDVMYIVQNISVVDTLNLQTKLEAYNDIQHQIERLQAQLEDLKGKSMNTQCVSNTLDPLSQKLDDENVSLEVDNVVPNKHVKASVRTKSITISQPYVITKKDVNSNTNGLSSTRVESTTKTRRPQPRSNTKNDRVPSASKTSCLNNNEVVVEEHHRNLLSLNNQKHMSSECNNIKLAIRNDKSELVCASCKKCLITANHDVLKKDLLHLGRANLELSLGGLQNFDLSGNIIESRNSECYQNLFIVHRLGLLQAYDQESKAAHQLHLEVYGNCSLWE
ncbi:hypothetical protein Tco_0804673 [Tanacetum coccineum]|uniref:Uncharacterized protein n=1 Tax=Tanacetum coccineum TaxID=301880 RepID=A0ABQ5A9A1_9ASTR